jgi:type II secretory pathway pseudopilin PulG
MRGYTLIDMLIVIVVLTTLFAISIPALSGAADAARLRGAAFHISARLALVRMQAVRRYANVALRFQMQNGQYRYQTFADGDGDGVKSADITSGRDVPIGEDEGIGDNYPGVSFGFLPGCPLVGGGTPGGNPIRIGNTTLLSVSPAGTATSGTLYLRGRGDVAYALVVLGATGRTTLLRCDARAGTWSVDAR